MKERNRFFRLSLVIAITFTASLLLATIGMAESGSPVKIGFVDVVKLMKESKNAKNSMSALQKEIESKRAIIKDKGEKLAGMDKELRSLKQDSAAWKEKRDKLTKEVDDFNRLRAEYDGQLQKKNNEVTQKIVADVQQIIKKIVASEKYTIILDKRLALFAEDSTDLTDKVIKMYDAQKK